jgi:hypothetical protein
MLALTFNFSQTSRNKNTHILDEGSGSECLPSNHGPWIQIPVAPKNMFVCVCVCLHTHINVYPENNKSTLMSHYEINGKRVESTIHLLRNASLNILKCNSFLQPNYQE